MTQPTPDQINVAVEALDSESLLWADLSQRLNQCAGMVTDLRITEYRNTTVFDEYIAAYNEVCGTFAARCDSGAVQTFEIGVRLLTVAQVYAREEEANLHAQLNLY
jgi:hypothetical protein